MAFASPAGRIDDRGYSPRTVVGVDEVGDALPTGTVTFLLTDVEGSTRMWDTDHAGASKAMERHDVLVDALLSAHRGVRPTEQGEGDSLVAVFLRARDALDCAIAIQRSFAGESWPEGSEVRVRMALHTGEAQVTGGNYRGAAVIRCARIRNLAHGGQLVISETTAHVIGDAFPEDVELVDLGSHVLKGLSRPERVFQVVHPELRSSFPPLASTTSAAADLPVGDAVALPTIFDVARAPVRSPAEKSSSNGWSTRGVRRRTPDLASWAWRASRASGRRDSHLSSLLRRTSMAQPCSPVAAVRSRCGLSSRSPRPCWPTRDRCRPTILPFASVVWRNRSVHWCLIWPDLASRLPVRGVVWVRRNPATSARCSSMRCRPYWPRWPVMRPSYWSSRICIGRRNRRFCSYVTCCSRCSRCA